MASKADCYRTGFCSMRHAPCEWCRTMYLIVCSLAGSPQPLSAQARIIEIMSWTRKSVKPYINLPMPYLG